MVLLLLVHLALATTSAWDIGRGERGALPPAELSSLDLETEAARGERGGLPPEEPRRERPTVSLPFRLAAAAAASTRVAAEGLWPPASGAPWNRSGKRSDGGAGRGSSEAAVSVFLRSKSTASLYWFFPEQFFTI